MMVESGKEPMMGSLGGRLADEMGRQHLTAEELSRRSGVKVFNIRRIINGKVKDPHISVLAAIAKGLGRSVDYLVWEVGRDDPEMTKVIGFMTYQWPYLTDENKRTLNNLLAMMVREQKLERVWKGLEEPPMEGAKLI
ncbi:MAG: helix-turn-helix transcriptional regulator [Syntrophorhabdaceae bacterium]|nr:helix-turn-helix transcriptional regulator [Syntrophorhabdaceae bacterium]